MIPDTPGRTPSPLDTIQANGVRDDHQAGPSGRRQADRRGGCVVLIGYGFVQRLCPSFLWRIIFFFCFVFF